MYYINHSLTGISLSVRFKGFCGSCYCCTTNICPLNGAMRDTPERKSILHLDSPASKLPQSISDHNLYLILTFTGHSPLSVISGCEIWAYGGGTEWLNILSSTLAIRTPMPFAAIYTQLVTKDSFSTTRDTINPFLYISWKLLNFSAALVDQSIRALDMLWCKAPSSIICQGWVRNK